jgi:hypothetical protein
LVPGLDLCTKTRKRGLIGAGLCYKSHSDCKYLILNDFLLCTIYGQSVQALDFSGRGGRRRMAINKVIHTNGDLKLNGFRIKDLGRIPSTNLKFNG